VIPELIDVGGPWKVLPPGVHCASPEAIKERFATNARREYLFGGFLAGFTILRDAGSKAILLDGSFVTDKPEPGDFDCCWDPTSVDVSKLHPTLLDFSNDRAAQKATFRGEFFPSTVPAVPGEFFLSFFQTDKYTGRAKGILLVQ
jgi:hypothetical protein